MADVFGVRVTPDLEILDSLIIICNDPGGQTDPSVIFNGENYIIVWADAFAHARDIALKAVRVDPEGNVIGSGVQFGSGNSATDIAFDGDRVLVVWSRMHDGIYGCFLNDQALPEDSIFMIDRITGSDARVRLAYDGTMYLVVWSDFDTLGMDRDVFGRRVTCTGGVVGDRIRVSDDAGHQVDPDVCFNGANFLIAWIEASGRINGRFVDPEGQPIGDIFPVSDTVSYVRDGVVAAAGSSSHLVAWAEWHYDFDIYGNCDIAISIPEAQHGSFIPLITTIVTGPLRYDPDVWTAYDVTGRDVVGQRVNRGVYFLRNRTGDVQKVVKIR